MASYFSPDLPDPSPLEAVLQSVLASDGVEPTSTDVDDLTEDEKKVVKALIVRREGQQKFRKTLISAYSGTCAVSGTSVEPTLDAAHIRPYSGPKSNVLRNGLLLRGGLHRLFDKHRLTVVLLDGKFEVRVDPALQGTSYGNFHGEGLVALPSNPIHHPAQNFLQEHHEGCDWLKK